VIDVVAIARASLVEAGLEFDHLSVIELNRSPGSETAFALLAFLDGQPAPAAFIKATADAGRAASLECEFANLQTLQQQGRDLPASSVPAPLFLGSFEGLTVLAESVLPGTRMKNFSPASYGGSRRFPGDVKTVVRWLDGFRRSFMDAGLPPSPQTQGGVAATVERYRERFKVSAPLDALLIETVDQLAPCDTPNPAWHGDFCTANLILPDTGGIGVIDWEYPLATCWPLADLLYFISSIRCVPRADGDAGRAAVYRHLLFEPHRHAGLFRESVEWYMQQAGLAIGLVMPLSVITWVVYANRTIEAIDGLRSTATGIAEVDYMPLVLLEDDRCLNLELLAELRGAYTLAPETG